MIWTVILIVCTISEPSSCRTVERTLLLSAHPTTAYMEAMDFAVEYLLEPEHQDLRMKDMRLEPGQET